MKYDLMHNNILNIILFERAAHILIRYGYFCLFFTTL